MSTNNGNTIANADEPPYKKKPLDAHLFASAHDGVDDVRVQTGYPIWNLIAAWIATGRDDDALLAGYSDMPRAEWEAAKQYYLDHKIIFDAKLITTTQPYADEETPPMRTIEEYFAWLAERIREDAQQRANTHG